MSQTVAGRAGAAGRPSRAAGPGRRHAQDGQAPAPVPACAPAPVLARTPARVPAWAAALTLALALVAVPAAAQSLSLDLGEGGSLTARTIQLILLLGVLSLVPGLAVMVTCFPFIVTVLSILRQALGLQQSPPNILIISLSLFLTWFVMDPVFAAAWARGLGPLSRGEMDLAAALPQIVAPFRGFMAARVDPDTFQALQALRPGAAGAPGQAALSLLVPSFMLSEIARAFQIGFLIFLPFLIIDLVTAAVLTAMGMMMVPPAVVSLPFKLAFFVVANGWSLISAALVRSYA